MTEEPLQEIAKEYLKEFPEEATQLFSHLPIEACTQFISSLENEIIVEIAPLLSRSLGIHVLKNLDAKRRLDVMASLPLDSISVLSRGFQREDVDNLSQLPKEKLSILKSLLSFSADTAGAVMDPSILAVLEDEMASSVFERFRSSKQRAIYYIYVVNSEGILLGVVTIKQVLSALEKNSPMGELMNRDVISLFAKTSVFELLRHKGWKRFHALPVTDEKHRFLGVVPYEVMRRLEQSLAPQDYQASVAEACKELGRLYLLGLKSVVETGTSFVQAREGGGS
jgi:magnesium transporter